jgi:hypothetical protein
MSTIFVKIKRRFYKVRVNPSAAKSRPLGSTPDEEMLSVLYSAYSRQSRRGNLASMIRIERQIRRMEEKLRKNPLSKGKSRSAIDKNINYLMHHPGELTAKTATMKRKQAVAIALSVWRKANKKKRRR